MTIHDHDLEAAVIGAAILARGEFARPFLALDLADFDNPRHQTIASAIRGLMTRGLPVGYDSVYAALSDANQLRAAGGGAYLAKLTERAEPAMLGHSADRLREIARVRAAALLGEDLAQFAEGDDAAAHIGERLFRHQQQLEQIPNPLGIDDDDTADTLDSILREPDRPEEWLIPGLLSRQERVVVVAAEGGGKTTLLRQIAVCAAGGLHPWTGQRVADGMQVLFIDPENSRDQSRRTYRWVSAGISNKYRLIAPGWAKRITHKTRNEGVDLPGRDAAWFLDVAHRAQPDLLILGSAYKLMAGDPQRDRDVLDLFAVIDQVRVQHNCAVLIETHAPHGGAEIRNMRPYGSSVWRRWPEVGLGYQRDQHDDVPEQFTRPRNLECVEWRGSRENRDWPGRIMWGPTGLGLPWEPFEAYEPSVDAGYQIPNDEGKAA